MLIGGFFTRVNGVSHQGIAPLIQTAARHQLQTRVSGFLGDGIVNAVAMQSDGKIIIGGAFTVVEDVSREGIARLNTDGTLDSSFTSIVSRGCGHYIPSIVIQQNCKVLIGGGFCAETQSIFTGLAMALSTPRCRT